MYRSAMTSLSAFLAFAVVAVDAGEQAKTKREPIYKEDGKGLERVELALVAAKRENKRVLLKIGGNWCGWCYKLHNLFQKDKAVQTLLRDEYEWVLIDQQRMKGAMEVIHRIRKPAESGGIPWFAFLDRDGRILITSTRPGTGNIGFPADPNTEIPYFIHMLKETRSKITDADIELIAAELARPAQI